MGIEPFGHFRLLDDLQCTAERVSDLPRLSEALPRAGSGPRRVPTGGTRRSRAGRATLPGVGSGDASRVVAGAGIADAHRRTISTPELSSAKQRSSGISHHASQSLWAGLAVGPCCPPYGQWSSRNQGRSGNSGVWPHRPPDGPRLAAAGTVGVSEVPRVRQATWRAVCDDRSIRSPGSEIGRGRCQTAWVTTP